MVKNMKFICISQYIRICAWRKQQFTEKTKTEPAFLGISSSLSLCIHIICIFFMAFHYQHTANKIKCVTVVF